MKIGLTFDLRQAAPVPAGAPDDLYEEFDSPETVAAIAAVLRDLGHQVVELGAGPALLQQLLAAPPDFIFNFAEGQGVSRSREARVPAVLEMLGVPYSGSDPATLAVCLDKDWTRRLVASAGVVVPGGVVVEPTDDALASLDHLGLAFPLIAKPVCEGSSKGIRSKCVIQERAQLAPVVRELAESYRQPILVEEFIAGDELTVGIVGNNPKSVLGIMRIIPRQPTEHFIYSLDVKRDYERCVQYECPARLEPAAAAALEQAALRAYRVLGCRDVARLDFRLRAGVPYFLEANPLPGLSPVTGDLVLIAKFVGVSHAQLVERILHAALERHGVSTTR